MSKTKFAILGLLAEQPYSGYELKQLIDIRFRFFWSESFGQIYPEIKKLLQEDMIEKLQGEVGNRNQQKYQITSKGLDYMRLWMMEPVEKESIRMEFLLKMYFSDHADSDVMKQHIQSFQSMHELDLFRLQGFKQELKKVPDPYGNHQAILKVIEFGIKTNEAYVTWCKETMIEMEPKK